MAERTDDGRFQINDIELTIPPEHIRVQRDSVNHLWQTLRTRSSIKVKSGMSMINITLNVKFTDTITGRDENGEFVNGLSKLRDLVSQFRVTPFCYVENLFLRNTILGGAESPNMALALKQMQIIKSADPSQGVNVVDVVMHFSWFNYLPYLRDFSFKEKFFSSVETKDPRKSQPWKLLYQAEQQRLSYVPIKKLDGSVHFEFAQFAQMQIKKYNMLRKDVQALERLKSEILTGVIHGNNNIDKVGTLVYNSLNTSLGDPARARMLAEEIVGGTTSMKPRVSSTEELFTSVWGVMTDGSASFGNEEVWSPVVNNRGDVPRYVNEPTATQDSKPGADDTIMLERKRQMHLESAGLIVTHISISFENILANIPLIGHTYPTFQHIGSVDAVVTMSMLTTGESSVRALSQFYSIIEDQALKYKMIPQGQRNLVIANDLINMCGLREFIPNSLIIETIPGQPGTYSASLELIDNPLTAATQEQITAGQSFTSSEELRKKIADVIIRNLNIIPDAIPGTSGFFDIGGVNVRDLAVREERRFTGAGFQGMGTEVRRIPLETGYYVYTGARGGQHVVFQKICEEFGAHMGGLYKDLVEEFIPVAGDFATGALAEFFSLTDEQVPGIEKLQVDILDGLKKRNKIVRFGNKTFQQDSLGNVNVIRDTAHQVIATSQAYSLESANRARELRDEQGANERITTALEEGHREWYDRVATFVNDKLAEWLRFSTQYLDNIALAGWLNLEQFQHIEDEYKKASIASSGNCYPDFPLDNVVNLMRSSKDPHIQQTLEVLEEDASDRGLSLKNVGISSLLGPDFYFFNHQNDGVGRIIPDEVLEEARQAISESQGVQQLPTEKKWFNEIYDEKILGQNRAKKVKDQIFDTLRDKEFWSSNAEGKLRDAQSAVSDARSGASVFAPNDLIDVDEQGLGPSIFEHQNASGDKYGPISLVDITDASDEYDTVAVRRTGAQLTASNVSAECKHFFGLGALASHAPCAYEAPNNGTNNDPNNAPIINPPIANWRNRITSRANPNRRHPVTGKIRPHTGLDFGCPIGTQIKCAADGKITWAGTQQDKKTGQPVGAGHYITVQHSGGYRTRYFHLSDDETFFKKWVEIYKRDKNSPLLNVKAGQNLCLSGNSGIGTGPHLHFEVWRGSDWLDPEQVLQGNHVPVRQIPQAIDPQNDSLLSKSVEQLEKDMVNGQGYSMARAYPTFRFYFIESDMGERKRFAFDDMFGYSSVKEIQLVRSRKIASDLLIVQLTNVSGVLSKRKFNNAIAFDAQGNEVVEQPNTPQRTNTVNENPIAALNLQPGIQVQLRLGYSSNPQDLEIVFNGVIADAAFTESDDLVTLTCQSFAIELVKNIHGEAKSYGGWLSGGGRTARILEEMMAMPEVVHFGRWEGGAGNLGLYRDTINTRWRIVPSPQDDNIFAPVGRGIFGLFDSTEKYTLFQSTIWDVFQEMTLRHPGYVAAPVPYEGEWGPRMTMFFGVPDQMYFARDPELKEKSNVNQLRSQASAAKGQELEASGQAAVATLTDPTQEPQAKWAQKISEKEPSGADKAWLETTINRLAMNQGIIRPFRNYHVLTSTNHIVYNNISSSGYNTFNTVTLQYGDDEANPSEKTGELDFGDLQTFTLRCDAALPDEEVKELFAQYPNCVGYEMAKRYTVGLLWWALKEGYKGNIIVIGNPKIKPYDICYIFDEYSDMFGPVEVEQVVHKFSQQNGFVTEITPDMVLHVNQASTLSTSDAMGLMVEHGLKQIGLQSLPSVLSMEGSALVAGAGIAAVAGAPLAGAAAVAGAGAILSDIAFAPIANMFFNSGTHSVGGGAGTNPFGLIGAFIFRKLITRTQLAHPFRASALVKNGQPMIGGLPNKRTDGNFVQGIRKWAKEADEGIGLMLSDLYDKIHPNYWFGRTTGSFSDMFWGNER